MHILALRQGHYGERIVEHIKKSAPEDWVIDVVIPPRVLPIVVEDPEEFLPSNMPQADLLLAMSESREAAQLVPAIVALSRVKAMIMPVDNSAWLPPGLKQQLKREIVKMGVAAAFPKTFCTLTGQSTGFGSDIETYENEHIASFAAYFGKPKLKIEVDERRARIVGVKVERSAPCGSTHHAAKKLVGMSIDEAVPQAGLYTHLYPCLASMQMEPSGDTLMHISGYVVNDEVERQLGRFRGSS